MFTGTLKYFKCKYIIKESFEEPDNESSNESDRAAILKKNSLWLLPFYMAVATYCYYEKVRRTMCTAIVSCLHKSSKVSNKYLIANQSQMKNIQELK